MKKTICDACSTLFTLEGLETVIVERDIQKTFFTCPHCGHEFVVYYTNAKARKLMLEQQKILGRNGSLLDPGRKRKYDQNRAAIKAIYDMLKARYAV